MTIAATEWIFQNGEWVKWQDATVHVSAHSLHYGSGAFEGIRAYETPDGPAIFRLQAHIRRLLDSCKLLRMDMTPWSQERLERVCVEAVSRNGLRSCYIRPLVYRGGGGLGLNPSWAPLEVAVFAVEWGRYLGADSIDQGVDAMISSWRRFNSSTAMPLGKFTGQYTTSSMVSIEARSFGFDEGIMLDEHGHVCEGAGENLFMVFGDELVTPPLSASILGGITRDSVITLARDSGTPVRFETVSRDMLYLCDELFMTGTAAEICPVRSVDRIAVGSGRRGPITQRLQEQFFDIALGRIADRHRWLTPVVETRERELEAATRSTTRP